MLQAAIAFFVLALVAMILGAGNIAAKRVMYFLFHF